jgi:hypothetical protein
MYSKSKCSNWAAYDPYFGEIAQIRNDQEPTAEIVLSEEIKIKVLERPLHEAFLRPYTIRDIEETLALVPSKFLVRLSRMLLLGGTKKQELCGGGNNFYFGRYHRSNAMIALHAFPRKMMKFFLCPRPHWLQEYIRAGAVYRQEGNYTVIEFNEQSLKMFYLRDVLIHEIGHHVDCLRRGQMGNLTEEFAHWFADEYGYRYKKK